MLSPLKCESTLSMLHIRLIKWRPGTRWNLVVKHNNNATVIAKIMNTVIMKLVNSEKYNKNYDHELWNEA